MQLRSHFRSVSISLSSLYMFGDSICKGVNEAHISRALGVRFEGFSINGAKVDYVFDVVKFAVGKFVDEVVVMVGTNNLETRDGRSKLDASELVRKFQTFDRGFHRVRPDTFLILCHILNRPRNENTRIEPNEIRLNEMMSDRVWNGKFHPMANVLKFEFWPSEIFAGGLHLKPEENERLTQSILCALAR